VGADVGIDAVAPCTGPFQPPIWLSALSSPGQEAGGTLSDDGLELYFGSDRAGGAGGADLYVATRASKQVPFGAPTRIVELATSMSEDDPFIDPDGLTLWFNAGGNIVRATRATRTSAWDPPTIVVELKTDVVDEAPGFTSDGLTVYFDSNRPPNLGFVDLWSATRPTRTSPFASLRHELVASSNSFDCCPHVLPGDTQVAFTTQRGGGTKVYAADRLPDGSLGAAAPYPLVNTSALDFDIFSTPDGTTVGVSSDRLVMGDADLWLYERSCP
jgi:Tol biopolymer transport system component